MKYFVTGATGFIGGRVVQKLVEAKHEVIALARNPQAGKHLAQLGVTIEAGDVTDKSTLLSPMKGVDGVFHIAGWYKVGSRGKDAAYPINVEGTRNVLEVMREHGIKKGVYTSTLAVYSDTKGQLVDENYRYDGSHLSEYDRTKWIAHYKVAEPMMKEGLGLVIVLPGVVYGPGDTSAIGEAFEKYLAGKLPMIPKGTTLTWAHIDDIAQGHILAMEKGKSGQSYIIAGALHTMEEVFDLAERITSIKAPRIRVGIKTMKFMASMMKVVGAIIPLPNSYTSEGLRVIAGTTYLGNNEKAKRELGYTVRPLEEGLPETLKHLMNTVK
jgi:nucleoside-diphosphate-sugar epimerase